MTEHASCAQEETRRDFLHVATAAVAVVGAAHVAWPFIDQMNPSADVLALSSVEVDLSPVPVGQQLTVNWRGKPVFIRHRTEEDIVEARAVSLEDLPDPQSDEERVERAEWLIMVGVCTHLGCIPLADQGDYGGWFCPCHGSHYDTSGRIRLGPAPENLPVPGYAFTDDTTVVIG
ncbi:MAG: ubiquinol-cytochrome c reductase iron-sulfur subunit [Rhodospirillales bacterium]|nr:ubiquinol-cytochrome c reductase iron-sulfur subunit [Rhodospirillales bacterium]